MIIEFNIPNWLYPADIKHIILLIIVLILTIFSLIIINKEIKKLLKRKFREIEEDRLKSEYEFIYGDRTKWPNEINIEFDKKLKRIQEKFKIQ